MIFNLFISDEIKDNNNYGISIEFQGNLFHFGDGCFISRKGLLE